MTEDKKHASDMEIHFITEYGTYGRGYNMSSGGEASPMHREDVRAKISATKKGKPNTWSKGNQYASCPWYTNGIESIKIRNGNPIPIGFYPGRTISRRAKYQATRILGD